MPLMEHEALALFLALFALYSPVAALGSYLPILRPYRHSEVIRLSVGLALNVAIFVLLAIWVGELLLKLLGISTAALTATGGVALAYEAIPLMRGQSHEVGGPDPAAAPEARPEPRSVLFTPLTFPLTVGGTTFAFGVAASAVAASAGERGLLSLAAIAYAAVTGITLYLAGRVQRTISLRGAMLLDRLAGILLTAIAVILLANGFTDLVLARIHG
jgi:multiple antibiotic resistance protein